MNRFYVNSEKDVSKICNEIEILLYKNGYICVDDFISSESIEIKNIIKEELIRKYRDSDAYNKNMLLSFIDKYKDLKNKYTKSQTSINEEKLISIKRKLVNLDFDCQNITQKLENMHKELNENNFRRFFLEDVHQEIEKRKDRLYRKNEVERLEERYKEIESLNSELNDILSQIDDLQMKIELHHSQINDLTEKLNELRDTREIYIEEESRLTAILSQEKVRADINKKLISDSMTELLNYIIFRITIYSGKLYIHNVFKYKLIFIEETRKIHEIIENVNKVNNYNDSRTNEKLFEELLTNISIMEGYLKFPFKYKYNNYQTITPILEKFLEYYRVAINRSLNNKNRDESLLFFRGHTDSNYLSIPSVFRNQGFIENEHIMFHEIQVRCSTEMVNSKSYLEKLTSMQHYSLPTRLLDVTSSVMVALFFAVERNFEIDGELIIYNLYKNELKYFDSDTVEMLSALSTLSYSDKQNLLQDTIEASIKLIVNSFPKSKK
ncbi:FRG domain-containing protein [Lysinibacillus sp. FN11]|nr:FRG domain-containing protein [Lysinibacillus sp. FN11]UUV26029.1 FRG domain-containing protein [Lysinibacillus sp. FN11]